jgi:probable metal-binding protein
MPHAVTIHDHEIIELISKYPDGIRLSQLMDAVADRYGKLTSFHSSSARGMDLDGVLRLLEAREKVRIVRGVVYPGASPASVA